MQTRLHIVTAAVLAIGGYFASQDSAAADEQAQTVAVRIEPMQTVAVRIEPAEPMRGAVCGLWVVEGKDSVLRRARVLGFTPTTQGRAAAVRVLDGSQDAGWYVPLSELRNCTGP